MPKMLTLTLDLADAEFLHSALQVTLQMQRRKLASLQALGALGRACRERIDVLEATAAMLPAPAGFAPALAA